MPAWTGHSYNLFRVDVSSGAATQIARGRTRNVRMAESTMAGRRCATTRTTAAPRCVCMATPAETDDGWSLIAKYGRGTATSRLGVRRRCTRRRTDLRPRPQGRCGHGQHLPFDMRTTALGPAVSEHRATTTCIAIVATSTIVFTGVTWFGGHTQLRADRPETAEAPRRRAGGTSRARRTCYVLGADRAATRLLLEAVGRSAPGDFYLYDVAPRQARLRHVRARVARAERLRRRRGTKHADARRRDDHELPDATERRVRPGRCRWS